VDNLKGVHIMRKFSLLFIILLLAGCNEHVITITPPLTLKPIEADLDGDYGSIQLKKVVCDIATGKTIGHTNKQASAPVIFTSNDEGIFKRCIEKNFYSAFNKAGYKTFGGDDALFDEYKNISPDFIIGAKVVDIRQNRKIVYGAWDTKLAVEQFIEIEWQVYSRQAKCVVGTYHNKGYYKDSIVVFYAPGISLGQIMNSINNSIRIAVNNLLANPEFIEILKNNKFETAKSQKKRIIRKVDNHTKPINENSSLIRSSVITIKSSGCLGSGFIIATDGYALTNAHVVGTDSIVQIKLATGKKCLADVIYKESERDVALLKIEQDGLNALPINNGIISVGDEIYAMGIYSKRCKYTAWK